MKYGNAVLWIIPKKLRKWAEVNSVRVMWKERSTHNSLNQNSVKGTFIQSNFFTLPRRTWKWKHRIQFFLPEKINFPTDWRVKIDLQNCTLRDSFRTIFRVSRLEFHSLTFSLWQIVELPIGDILKDDSCSIVSSPGCAQSGCGFAGQNSSGCRGAEWRNGSKNGRFVVSVGPPAASLRAT